MTNAKMVGLLKVFAHEDRLKIIGLFGRSGHPIKSVEIREHLESGMNQINKHLSDLCKAGILERFSKNGKYDFEYSMPIVIYRNLDYLLVSARCILENVK